MDEFKSHIFVRHPDRKKNTCWSCAAKKEEHSYVVQQPAVEMLATKTRKKRNARFVRSKNTRIRAVR